MSCEYLQLAAFHRKYFFNHHFTFKVSNFTSIKGKALAFKNINQITAIMK